MKLIRTLPGKIVFLFLVFSAAWLLAGCSGGESDGRELRSHLVMDTKVDITLYGLSAREATAVSREVFAEMERLEQILSRHEPDSDISRINQAAGQEWVTVEQETLQLLQEAVAAARMMDGAFDPTVGALLRLWGFGTEEPRVPTTRELEQALEQVDYEQIQIDEANSRVFLARSGMSIDVGGIAKGFIVDRGQEVTAAAGVKAAFINAGGDISIRGPRPAGGKWRVAVQDPDNPQAWIAIIELEAGSIATSGDYQRFFEEDGELYHHILDTASGLPARDVSSVTVTGPSTSMVDALSTGIFVLGAQRGLALLETLPEYEGLIVDQRGEIFISPGLQDDVELL